MAYTANGPPQVGNGLGVNLNVSGTNMNQQPRIGGFAAGSGNSVRVAHINKESPSIVKSQMQMQMGQRLQKAGQAGPN